MKLTAVLMWGLLLHTYATPASGQRNAAQLITYTGKSVSLQKVFLAIERQTQYAFFFQKEDLKDCKPVTIALSTTPLKEALEKVLVDQPLEFELLGKTIFISRKKAILKDLPEVLPNMASTTPIKGRVTDNSGNPLQGATVSVKGKPQMALTDRNGNFSLEASEGDVILISFIGYESQTIRVGKDFPTVISLATTSSQMSDVVVTGMFERKKGSFTGSANTIAGERLRSVGNQNVIQAIRSLDPSFILVDNNLKGSDPNALARIELRGKTSLTETDNMGALTDQFAVDPNSPLFILDGFESTLRQITDLDINRIASITLLKDAASTALYGARSANGVIVVETIRPAVGELRVNYTADLNLNVADLRDYNMMNAAEKLEFEKLAGRYNPIGGAQEDYVIMDAFYNQRLKAIREGVNTYWLNEPLRSSALTQNHSLYVSGGSNEFQYGVGANMQNVTGVMKGSDRKNWGGRADLTYRKGKFNISNRIFVSGYRADESPYGAFRTYVNINPYYKKVIAGKYVEQTPSGFDGRTRVNVPNPLYNAQLNSEQYSYNLSLQNNLGFNLDLNKSLRITGGFQLLKNSTTAIQFVSPQNTFFDNSPLLQKGSYTNVRSEGFNYTANLAATYNRVIKEKHVLTGNARAEMQEINNNSIGFTAVGFPVNVTGNPGFAYSYAPNSKPSVLTPPKTRRVNALASMNYVFDNRFFVDATYRIDGSTAFGSAEKYSPFWAAGLGWSVHKERMLDKATWINSLILRGNIGTSGNQNFGSFASATVYNLEPNANYFGQGLYHTSLGNPNLDWQKTLQTSIGIDMGLLENRATATIDYYNKYTDPLIITLDLPGSNGIMSYPMNLGNMTVQGIEATLRYSPVFNLKQRIIWTLGVMGGSYQSRYNGFGSKLNNLNTEKQLSNSIQRFMDGNSPDDIWAVESKGIDPGSGREVFVKKDGTYTLDFDPADIKAIANGRPKAEGVLSSSLRIKHFTMDVYLRYSIGAYRFNNALYEKVENISFGDLGFNQDKRAMEVRWKNPGDISQFKAISLTEFTPISSRFVQKENIMTGESISLGYELTPANAAWLKSMRLQNLRFTALMNNIFRISNIVSERGLDYPFANTVSFRINASF